MKSLNLNVASLAFIALLLASCVPDAGVNEPTALDGSALPTAPENPTSSNNQNGEEEPNSDGEIITQEDVHHYDVEERAIDLLFVVDNSGSMAGEQQILTDSFNGFIDAFTQRAINARIGVTSTDMTGTSGVSYGSGNAYNNFIQKGKGSLIARVEGSAAATPRYLDSETMTQTQLVNRFRSNALLGTSGSGSENGIGALAAFFGAALNGSNGWNSGFIRGENVPFHAIIITDEDMSVADQTSSFPGMQSSQYMLFSPTAFQNYFNQTMAVFNSVKTPGQGLFKIHTVAGDANSPHLSNCDLMTQGGRRATGDGYKSYTQATHGTFIDLCAGPFHQSLIDLGQEIAVEVERDFALSRLPRDSSLIRVWVNNVELVQGSASGFTYRATENEIRIGEGVYLDHLDQYDVKIQYTYEQL